MLKNYLKIAVRSILKNKVYSFINIVGLAVGVACCIAILLYIQNELSYDKFNKFADRICRVTLDGEVDGHDINPANSPAALGPTVYHDIPGVETYVRLFNDGSQIINYKDKTFFEERFFWADQTIFNVFTFSFVEGNLKTAFDQPNSVVITESTARKYFGDKDPLGKILTVDKQNDYIVSGVIKDIPYNSHFHPDFIASLATLQDSRNPSWLSNNYYTYFLLKKGVNIVNFQKELNVEVKKYVGPQIKIVTGVSLQKFLVAGNRYGYKVQTLTSIHLNSHLNGEIEPNGNKMYVYIFSLIAIAILLIACSNFINLATARSERRAKEVGIRKTLGSSRLHLIRQFMIESIMMSSAATVIAVVLVELFLPLFNALADKKMSLDLFNDPLSILLLICFAAVVGIASGIYPACYLSSFKPIDVLKSKTKKKSRKSFVRNGLVVFQFTILIILFIGTFIIYDQLKYVQTKNLGFDKEETVVINRVGGLGNQIQSFEHELMQNKNIIDLTNSSAVPGGNYEENAFRLEGASLEKLESSRHLFCDFNFAKTYSLKMKDGRFFSLEHPSDSSAVVVNEALEKVFGKKSLVGKNLLFPGPGRGQWTKFKIIGVVKDFNYQSLHEKIRPLVFLLPLQKNYTWSFLTVRLAAGNHLSTISFIEKVWEKYSGNESFSYNFLDKNLQHLYESDSKTNEIVGTFSFLAIFIACLGLLGLVSFVTGQRTKEIGIRKVLGASIHEILFLITKEFIKWVLIANIIAWPVAYYIMNNWLNDFAYRIKMAPWIFVLAGVFTLLIALLTVSFHTIQAARANPVKSLRYE